MPSLRGLLEVGEMLLGDLGVALGPGIGIGDQLGPDGLKEIDELRLFLL